MSKLKSNRGEAIVEAAKRKLHGNSGETIVEALVSLIIAVISIALLVTSITAASKINAKSKARTTEQLSFAYVDESNSETGSVDKTKSAKITYDDTSLTTETIAVNVYTTDNKYVYYKTH